MTTSTQSIPIILGTLLVIGISTVTWIALPGKSVPVTNESKITVAATIFPLADIASSVAGDHAQIIQLLPSGASPHSYNLTPQQLADIQHTQTIFAIGHGLDDWASRSAAGTTEQSVTIVDSNIHLRAFDEKHQRQEDEAKSVDPHYWLTVPNAKKIAQTISQKLQEIDPANATAYQQQTTAYVAELDALEANLQAQAQRAPHKQFIAVHNSWSYFAEHYGLELIATYEPIEGRSPSVNDIKHLQELIQEYGIQTFFTEPQKQTSSSARFFEQELGLTVKTIDPVGGIGNRDSYSNLMLENMASLTN